MGEINASEHVGKIFTQAQKLMAARQALITAQMEADAAERELTRLNGSTNLDLSRFERVRYFTCEGPVALMVLEDKSQEAGVPAKIVAQCQSVIGLSSWDFKADGRPEEPPVCDACRRAIKAATPPKPAEKKGAA